MGLLGTPRSCLYDFTHTKHAQAVTHSWRTMPRVPSRQRESIGERVGVERHRGSLFPRKGCFHAFYPVAYSLLCGGYFHGGASAWAFPKHV